MGAEDDILLSLDEGDDGALFGDVRATAPTALSITDDPLRETDDHDDIDPFGDDEEPGRESLVADADDLLERESLLADADDITLADVPQARRGLLGVLNAIEDDQPDLSAFWEEVLAEDAPLTPQELAEAATRESFDSIGRRSAALTYVTVESVGNADTDVAKRLRSALSKAARTFDEGTEVRQAVAALHDRFDELRPDLADKGLLSLRTRLGHAIKDDQKGLGALSDLVSPEDRSLLDRARETVEGRVAARDVDGGFAALRGYRAACGEVARKAVDQAIDKISTCKPILWLADERAAPLREDVVRHNDTVRLLDQVFRPLQSGIHKVATAMERTFGHFGSMPKHLLGRIAHLTAPDHRTSVRNAGLVQDSYSFTPESVKGSELTLGVIDEGVADIRREVDQMAKLGAKASAFATRMDTAVGKLDEVIATRRERNERRQEAPKRAEGLSAASAISIAASQRVATHRTESTDRGR